MLKDKDIKLNMVVYLDGVAVRCPVYITSISYCNGCGRNHYQVIRVFGKTNTLFVSLVADFKKINSI